jgi:hypothetical protein
MSEIKNLPSHTKHSACCLSGSHAVVRGLIGRPAWRCATLNNLTAAQASCGVFGV